MATEQDDAGTVSAPTAPTMAAAPPADAPNNSLKNEHAPPDDSHATAPPSSPDTASAPPPDKASENTRTRLQTVVVVVSLCSALFLTALDVSIVTVTIPTIAGEFHSTLGYTWIGSSYLLANAATAPSWGKTSDIWGRKHALLVAIFFFWFGSLLCAVSRSMPMLIGARAIQGIGGGGITILTNICVSDLFSMRQRPQYFGLFGLVWAFAGGIGPVIGGALTSHATWRWCFYLNLPISGACFVMLIFVLKLHNPKTGMREGLAAVDWLGSATIISGTLMVLLALTFGGVSHPWRSATVICLLVVGGLLLALFAVIEVRWATYPVIPLRLFRRRTAIAALACGFFHGTAFIGGTFYLPLYFQAVLGASALMSGVYVLPLSIMLAGSSALTGLAIRKTGQYLVFIIGGFVLLALGYGLFTDLGSAGASDGAGAHGTPVPNWAKIVLYQLVAACGVGPLFQSPMLALQNTVPQAYVATATATYTFLRQLSTAISVAIGGVVFQNRMQSQHDALVARIGQKAADLLTGSNAASSVYLVDALDGPARAAARQAYWTSIQTMFIMYAAFAGTGLLVSLFVQQTTLSTEHQEQKTGLRHMQRENRGAKKARQAEEAEAARGVVVPSGVADEEKGK